MLIIAKLCTFEYVEYSYGLNAGQASNLTIFLLSGAKKTPACHTVRAAGWRLLISLSTEAYAVRRIRPSPICRMRHSLWVDLHPG